MMRFVLSFEDIDSMSSGSMLLDTHGEIWRKAQKNWNLLNQPPHRAEGRSAQDLADGKPLLVLVDPKQLERDLQDVTERVNKWNQGGNWEDAIGLLPGDLVALDFMMSWGL